MTPVDNPGHLPAKDEESRIRRFAWMTREDVQLLEQLPAAARRPMERLLHNQANSDAAWRARVTLESDLATAGRQAGTVEGLHGLQTVRWTHGAGGGRKKTTPPPFD